MKKTIKIIILVVLVLIIAAIAAAYLLKPVAYIEKRLNEQIAENLKENGVELDIVLYDMVYDFPLELEAHGYIKSEAYDLLVELKPIKIFPRVGSLFSSTRIFDMRGDALGGWFSGSFALGASDDFHLEFDRLQTKEIKYASSKEPLSENLDLVLSGNLQIYNDFVGADAVINSARIGLPGPLDMAGGILYFHNGRINFEIVNDEFVLKDALLESEDVSLAVAGRISELDSEERQMDMAGTLFVHNEFLVKFLNLWSPQNDTSEFRFSLTGPADDPTFRFVGPDGKVIDVAPEHGKVEAEEDSSALLESIDIPNFEEDED